MRDWLYTVRQRFFPDSAYLAFSGFKDTLEIVTLDLILCPDVISELDEDDWKHNVHKDFQIMFFRDLEYLMMRKLMTSSRHQYLAIFRSPDGSEIVPAGFTLCGFDIMDSYVSNSTLTNCGRISEAFDPSIVNAFGLISDWGTAIAVRDRMRHSQPDDSHLGACDVWLIARSLPHR